jgi:hypothetical protein
VSANQKKLIAYAFCLLVSIILGGIAAFVIAEIGCPALVIAGAAAATLLGGMDVGARIIGPFEFRN